MSEASVIVGLRVRRFREQRKLSLRAFADQSGVPFTSLHRIQHGRSDLWLSAAVRIAAAMGCTLDALVAEPKCGHCLDMPPAGFTCDGCGEKGGGR